MARKQKEYEVERIVRAKVSYKKGRSIHWKYLVKWKGYSDKVNTWEPIESFEESPKLIEKFWSKVDLGDRDPKKASSFQVREEVAPRDDTWSDEDAEGEEEEEHKEGGGEVGASVKAARKKRPSGAPEGAPKRKRGRPSKAEKEAEKEEKEKRAKETDTEEKEKAEGVAEGDVNGAENGDGESASRQNPRRLSDQQMDSYERTNDARLKRLVRPASTVVLSSEDEEDYVRKEPTPEKSIRESPLKKRRKAYLESDEEDDIISVTSSHGGSLFSGSDSEAQEQEEEAKSPEAPGRAADLAKPKIVIRIPPTPEPSEEIRNKTNRLGRPVKAKVKMIDDPSIGQALEERVARLHARVQGTSLGTSPSSGNDGTTYRPTLLTSQKGKLVSQRNNVASTVPWRPLAPSTRVESEPVVTAAESDNRSTTPGTPLETDGAGGRDTAEATQNKNDSQDLDRMDTSPDFAPTANIVGRLEKPGEDASIETHIGPPPTAEELLRLSGASGVADELPDFQPGEDVEESSPVSNSITSAGVPQEGAGTSAVSEVPPWKQTSIFSAPTPKSILEKIITNKPLPEPKPAKLAIPLRLNTTAVLPVTLKDIDAARNGPALSALLKPGQLEGPPGKLFPPEARELFRCVQKAGSSARVVPDEGCTDEQRSWFSKLVEELEQGSLFVLEIAGNTFMLCSSENSKARMRLLMVTSNTGLSKTVLIQHIPIIDPILYASCASKARDLQFH